MEMKRLHLLSGGVGIVVTLVASGCAVSGGGGRLAVEIPRILGRQADAWNAGDIETFMQAYDASGELTFSSGGRVTRGWKSTLDDYRKRYPNRAAMGFLTFSDLEITPLGPAAALVLGRWHLRRDEPVGGAFSLVLRKGDRGWRIIHDHTSRDAG
jgi:beta-aspartyl-peptidase (threonine type)